MNIDILHDEKRIKYIKEIAFEIACTTCLVLTLLLLCDMGNAISQGQKNIFAAKAILTLAIYMLFIQRPRLFNWQTLAVSLLYLPIGYAYRMRYSMAPDLFNRDKVVVWIVWVALLIVTDMYVYKKVNPLQKFNTKALAIYALMTITMTFYRNNRTLPAILILMFVFYLIPLNRFQWKRIINQFCNAWLITFIIILFRSLKNNPEVNTGEGFGRWYGDFVNIGDFGLFMACVTVVFLYKLYQTQKRSGFISIPYALHLLFLIPIIWTILRVSTITMYIGIACIFVMIYILITKNGQARETVKRFIGVIMGLFALIIIGLAILKALSYTDIDYWQQVLLEGNAFQKPIATIIHRAHYMFDDPGTFANCGIFEPDSFINYLDLFSSGRLSIIKTFSEYFNFIGNTSDGLQVGEYFAYNAHNAYAQVIYEYGYIGGGFFIVWLVYSTVASMLQFIRTRKSIKLFLCMWMAMTLGVLMGERVNLYTPIIMMTLMITYPIMINIPEKSKKPKVQ